MKRATIYLRGKDIFIRASSQTTAGAWICSEPCVKLDTSSSDTDVGLWVLDALRGSQSNVRHPAVWTGLIAPLLSLAKVKSWGTFAKNASSAHAVEESGWLTAGVERAIWMRFVSFCQPGQSR